jgi:predicted nucleotidyltransferase component of viral defense system
MIPGIEIREISRENGIPETTVERDYALNWVLVAISHEIDDMMALKGGTAIRKTYIGDYRFSEDLDFTLLVNIDKNMLEKKVITAVKKSKAESGINFNENIRIEETPNKTYEMVTYFRMLRKMGSPLRIRLDITRSEDEKIILPLKRRSIIHPYSDRCRGKILVYSLEEILAEKLRSPMYSRISSSLSFGMPIFSSLKRVKLLCLTLMSIHLSVLFYIYLTLPLN